MVTMAKNENYVLTFRKNVFGKNCDDIVYRADDIVVWYENSKTKVFSYEDFVEAVNLNTSCEFGYLKDMIEEDWEKISLKDGYSFKIKFKNGMLLEKSLSNAIHNLALLEASKV